MVSFELLSPGKYLPPDYWRGVAPQCRRVEVEFGPGDGRFLTEAARERPDTLFIGIEIRVGLVKKLREHEALIPNVRVYEFDARLIVSHLLADATVDAFHVYFPDPWWKKRHYKRRLITPDVAAHMRRVLVPGGHVFLITDVQTRFEEIRSTLVDAGFEQRRWSRSPDAPAQSSYERKYRRQGRTVYESSFAAR